ncbi:hypothetical protein RGQ29_032301 [Quercus rubra]|uniref:C2H2-type domain-containing protein n=1 Tax=Quercus rubra TaxID=3512 RepID=A0AAN7I4S4_QUERU|nr:hypothetical protein RGQ29_032301 [Quercus rubra]
MSKPTAAGGAGVGPSRRTWDVEEYTAKARERDRTDRERAQENEERIRKARSHPLNLDKDVGKTLMVDNSQDSRRGAGYYCEMCRKTFKDSIGYLDHINGRGHLRRLGQTQFVEKSSVEAVRKRIAMLLEKKKIAKERRGEEGSGREEEEEEGGEEEKRGEEPIATAGEGGGADDGMMKMMGFGGFGSRKK